MEWVDRSNRRRGVYNGTPRFKSVVVMVFLFVCVLVAILMVPSGGGVVADSDVLTRVKVREMEAQESQAESLNNIAKELRMIRVEIGKWKGTEWKVRGK